MERKSPFLLTEIVDGVFVTGEITRWERYSMHVITLSPYPGWEASHLIMSWSGLMYYGDFRSEKGEGLARCTLKTCYQKAKIVYTDLERLVRIYSNFIKELQAIDKVADLEIRHRIKDKLEDWFFDIAIFSRLSTGLFASSSDRKKIYEILDSHLMSINKN